MIGKHAAENNGNLSAQKKFKSSFPDLGESTVRLFKMKYLEAMKQRAAKGDSSPVTSIPSKKWADPSHLVIWILRYSNTLERCIRLGHKLERR